MPDSVKNGKLNVWIYATTSGFSKVTQSSYPISGITLTEAYADEYVYWKYSTALFNK